MWLWSPVKEIKTSPSHFPRCIVPALRNRDFHKRLFMNDWSSTTPLDTCEDPSPCPNNFSTPVWVSLRQSKYPLSKHGAIIFPSGLVPPKSSRLHPSMNLSGTLLDHERTTRVMGNLRDLLAQHLYLQIRH